MRSFGPSADSPRHAPLATGATVAPPTGFKASDWATLQRLFPYLWAYKWRVVAALALMIGAKLANVGVPLLLKTLVDTMSPKPGDVSAVLVVPVALLVAYAALRLSTSLFAELRDLIFAKATEGAARSISLGVFRHLHAMSLRFHLDRQTGGMTRDIERGTRAVHSLVSYSLYSIIPTLIEVGLVLALLAGFLEFSANGGAAQAVLMVAVVYGFGQLLESFFLTPRLVGERIGLHPLAVIFALLAFGQLFGFVGILVALPVSAVLLVAVRRVRSGYLASGLYQGHGSGPG